VAFGAVGKPFGNGLLAPVDSLHPRYIRGRFQRFLRPRELALEPEKFVHAPAQEARSPQIAVAARLDHARRRVRGAALPGPGHLRYRREDHAGRGREPAPGRDPDGVRARRPHRAELPGDLAPRQIGRRQVHLIPGEATRMARGAGPG